MDQIEQTQPNATEQQVTKAGTEAIQAWIRHNQRGVGTNKGIRPKGYAAQNENGGSEKTPASDAHYHLIVENQLAKFAQSQTLLRHDHIVKKVLRHTLDIGVYPWSTVGYTVDDLKMMLGGNPEATGRYWVSELTDFIGFAALLDPFASIQTEVNDDPTPEQIQEAIPKLAEAR